MRSRSSSRPLLLALAALLLVLLAGCGGEKPAAEPGSGAPPAPSAGGGKSPRVGLLVAGSVDDGGWNQLAKEGLDLIAKDLGAQTSHQQAKKADMAQALKEYARGGYNLVIAHGSEFGSVVQQVAPEFPDARFVVSAGDVKGPNYTSIKFDLAQPAYLLGIMAAHVSKSGKAGQIGGENFAPVAQAFRAFEAGAKSVKPGFTTTTDYVGDWSNANKAKEMALAMLNGGADVIFQNADAAGIGVFQAVQENKSKGILAFGSNGNQNSLFPDVILASAVLGIPQAFVQVARDAQQGQLKSDFYVEDMRGTARVELNPGLESRVPATAKAALEKAREAMLDGKLVMPPAPQ